MGGVARLDVAPQSEPAPSVRRRTARCWTAPGLALCLLVALSPCLIPDLSAGEKARVEVGDLLVARERIFDPNFRHTVVLVVDTGGDGVLGLVLNRTTTLDPVEILKQEGITGAGRTGIHRLRIGGPVRREAITFLALGGAVPPSGKRVTDEIVFGGDVGTLKEAMRTRSDRRLRVFSGFSGWSAEQLRGELRRGDWDVVRARSEQVFFDGSGEKLWEEISRLAGLPEA